jgi:DNA-binding CsgD family transcriptional regulator
MMEQDSNMRRATRSRPMLHDANSFINQTDWARISASLKLSSRESEISFLLLADVSEHTVADRLSISKHTVHSHIERLYRKLAIRSRSQLVVKLFEAYVCLNPPVGGAKDSAAGNS